MRLRIDYRQPALPHERRPTAAQGETPAAGALGDVGHETVIARAVGLPECLLQQAARLKPFRRAPMQSRGLLFRQSLESPPQKFRKQRVQPVPARLAFERYDHRRLGRELLEEVGPAAASEELIEQLGSHPLESCAPYQQ